MVAGAASSSPRLARSCPMNERTALPKIAMGQALDRTNRKSKPVEKERKIASFRKAKKRNGSKIEFFIQCRPQSRKRLRAQSAGARSLYLLAGSPIAGAAMMPSNNASHVGRFVMGRPNGCDKTVSVAGVMARTTSSARGGISSANQAPCERRAAPARSGR
jgi:hypothetical protein